jgi:flagellin
MGLRVNNNVTVLRALLNLNETDKKQATSLERLSTGLRINRASDDPSGLVISENLRAQLVALKRASQNAQNGANLLSVAETNLGKVADALRKIKDSVMFAIGTGATTPEQIQAEQDTVDSTLLSIDRIAKTTRFATRDLLNGASSFRVLSQSNQINNLIIKQAVFSGGQTTQEISLEPLKSARRAQFNVDSGAFTAPDAGTTVDVQVTGPKGSAILRVTDADTLATFMAKIEGIAAKNKPAKFVATAFTAPSGADKTAVVQITGPKGSANITLTDTDTLSTLADKINAQTNATGVKAEFSGGVTTIFTEETGSDKTLRLAMTSDTSSAGSIDLNRVLAYGDEVDNTGAAVTLTLDLTDPSSNFDTQGADATGVHAFAEPNATGNYRIVTEDIGSAQFGGGIFLKVLDTGNMSSAGGIDLQPVDEDGNVGSAQTLDFTAVGSTQATEGSNGSGNLTRAFINITQPSTGLPSDVKLLISGSRGSAEISLVSGATSAQVADAINQFSSATGVFAIKSGINIKDGSDVYMLVSEEFGSKQVIQAKVVSGTIYMEGVVKTAGSIVTASGTDATLKMGSLIFNSAGRKVSINTPFFVGSFDISPDVELSHSDNNQLNFMLPSRVLLPVAPNPVPGEAVTPLKVSVDKSGLTFQLGTKAQVTDSFTFGIPEVSISKLGFKPIQDPISFVVIDGVTSQKMITDVNSGRTDTILDTALKGGFLESLKSGGENDLFTNPTNALNIVDSAIDQISNIRGFLGSIVAHNLEVAKASIDSEIQAITETESMIRDVNFAEETANFTRSQILFQAGIAVLASANLIPQSVLALLR